MEPSRNAYKVLVGKPEGKRPLGRPRRRPEDNIKMDLRKFGCVFGDWIALGEYRDQWRVYVRAVINLRVRIFGIVVTTSGCHPKGPRFDSRLYPRNFSGSIGSGNGAHLDS